MKNSITMDWDKIAFSGSVSRKKNKSPFVSRLTGRTARDERPSEKRKRVFSPRLSYSEIPSPPLKKKEDGSVSWQARKSGKFLPKCEISASLAQKLGLF